MSWLTCHGEGTVRSFMWYDIIYDIITILWYWVWYHMWSLWCLVVSRTASSYSRPTPTIRIQWNRSTSRPILTWRGTAWYGMRAFNSSSTAPCVRQASRRLCTYHSNHNTHHSLYHISYHRQFHGLWYHMFRL
jgi:hypothetical protein